MVGCSSMFVGEMLDIGSTCQRGQHCFLDCDTNLIYDEVQLYHTWHFDFSFIVRPARLASEP